MNESFQENENIKLENIEKSGSVTSKNSNNINIHTITIIGQIEGHQILSNSDKTTKYEHIIPELVDIEQNPDIHGLLIILNTAGGDVEAGLAIAELISSMKTPSVSVVLGGGHSIGVPLAVSADKSFIVRSAAMTLHPVRMTGLVIGVEQSFKYFEQIQNRIVGFIEQNSKITAKHFEELINTTGELVSDVGIILDGENAVCEGIIDELGGLSDALDCLNTMAEKYKKNSHH